MSDERPFFELAGCLDEFIPLVEPTPEQVEEVLGLIASEPLQRYFFRHLAASRNPAWFQPLKEHGFFDAPPEPIARGDVISYPPWFALDYLVAVAPVNHGGVVAVARELHPRCAFDFLDLVQAAKTMPPTQAAQMVPSIIQWADEGMQIGRAMVSLAVDLAEKAEWDAALALADLILSPQEEPATKEMRDSSFFQPTATSRAEGYALQAFVEQGLAEFLNDWPTDLLRMIQENLEDALRIEGAGQPDFSWSWRPAIEPHAQNFGYSDIKNELVDAAVQTLSAIVETIPQQARAILEEYLQHELSIFRRLAIHVIRLNRCVWPDLWELLFTQPAFLEDLDVHHEFWLLMRETFGLLSESSRQHFVEQLLGRLPPEAMKEEDKEGYGRKAYLVLKQLWALDHTLLSDEHRKVVKELVREQGEPHYPDFLSYGSVEVGWTSSRSPKDLDQLTTEEIVAELRKPLPFASLDDPSHEGLARALKEVIAAKPQQFAPAALALLSPDVPPIHTHRALWGFREAWIADRSFDWAPVLALCERVSQTIDDVDTSGAPPDLEPDYWEGTYASARTSVADLLQAGVSRDDHAIPPEYLGQVRDILLTLADDPNPTPEYEETRLKDYSRRILDLALNVTRGRAIEALIQYALHFARITAQKEGEGQEFQSPQSRLEDVVRDKLTMKLDKRADPSLAVHSLFGKYLPNLHYLDGEWLVAHLEDVFPRQVAMSDYWEAAWEGYLFRSDFFGYLYEPLKPYYRHALEQLAQGPQGKAGSELARGRLARHLSALYWRGIETLDGEDSLIPLFFEAAPDDLRSSFIVGLRTALAEVEPTADSEEWYRAKALWIARAETMREMVEETGSLEGFVKELGAYAGWIPHIPSEEIEELRPIIKISIGVAEGSDTVKIVEFLPSIIEDHLRFAILLLEQIVEQGQGRWFLAREHEAIRQVLEAAMDSEDEEAASGSVRVINLFGERGDERYRPLLQFG